MKGFPQSTIKTGTGEAEVSRRRQGTKRGARLWSTPRCDTLLTYWLPCRASAPWLTPPALRRIACGVHPAQQAMLCTPYTTHSGRNDVHYKYFTLRVDHDLDGLVPHLPLREFVKAGSAYVVPDPTKETCAGSSCR